MLSRHIKLKHEKENRVKQAMEHNKNERDRIFAKFRWEGIVNYRQQTTLDKPKYQSEKKAENMKGLTRCSYCNITVLKSNFSRHQIKCKHDEIGQLCRNLKNTL